MSALYIWRNKKNIFLLKKMKKKNTKAFYLQLKADVQNV